VLDYHPFVTYLYYSPLKQLTMSQPEILQEILAKVSAIEEELKVIKTNLDQPNLITHEDLTELENRLFSKLDYAI